MPPDLLLRRLERTSMIVCAAMAVAALLIARGRPGPALGVVGGWLLMAIAYRSIRTGVDALIMLMTSRTAPIGADTRRRRLIAAIVATVGRYALLAFLAYVMIARLRLHPLGLIAGVSSAVAAVSIEAARLLVHKR